MPHEGLTGKSNCFANGCLGNAAVPFVENGLPIHAGGDLVKDVGNQNSGAAERGLAVADLRIGDDVPGEDAGLGR